MCSHTKLVRIVPPSTNNTSAWTGKDENCVVLTIADLADELFSCLQESHCPVDCWRCGNYRGHLPPLQFEFVEELKDTSPWAKNGVLATHCKITITQHFPSSIGYCIQEYAITAYEYSQLDLWRCLAPLMKRVQLSSLPNLMLDSSHVQILELCGPFRTEPARWYSSSSHILKRSEAELLRTILVSPTCQIFHLELSACSMHTTAEMVWDAVVHCPTLSILTFYICDLLAEMPSSTSWAPTPGPLSLSPNDRNNGVLGMNMASKRQDDTGRLKELTIRGSHVDENSVDSLCQLLQYVTPSSLQQVTLVDNDWPIDAGYKVASSLMHHTQLKSLDFTGLDTEYSTIQGIGQLIKTSSSLQKLNLSQVGDVIDARPLADGLIGSMLLDLDLSDNLMIHMDELARALQENEKLHTLNLSRTAIHDDDCDSENESFSMCSSIFFANLGNTRGLKVLILDEVKLSTETMNEFAQSLRINRSLEALHLNKIGGSVSWTSMFESLHDNTTLKTLHIGQNRFDQEDTNRLVEALCVNRSLRSVTLSRCGITDDNLILLGENLSQMNGLEDLDLCFNSFGAKGVMGLRQGLLSNHHLQNISLFNSACSIGGPDILSCDGYDQENQMVQALLQRNREALTSHLDSIESTSD